MESKERCFECGHEWVPGPDKCPKCVGAPTRKCRLCDTYVIERSDRGPGYIHAQDDWECKTIGMIITEADTYVSEPGVPGFDYCTHDEQPDYCDGCLYLRQKHAGKVANRVDLAIKLIDALTKDEPAYPTIPRADLERVRAILAGEGE